MDSESHSKNIFDDYDIKVMCDNCLRTKCICDEAERDAGFVKSYEGKTSGKYVCKDCKKIPVQCRCYEDEHDDQYDDQYDDYYDDERCDCGDCPDCGIPRPHMVGLWGYNKAMIGRRYKK